MEQMRERVRELAVRAGLAGVPEPVVLAVLVLVVVVCGVVGVRTWQAYAPEPTQHTAGPSDAAGGGTATAAAAPASSSETSQVVVYVSGRVRKPGVYRMAPGSRAADVVSAAGGTIAGADCAQVNLAKLVKDGEQIVIPGQGQGPSSGAAPAGLSAAGAPAGGAPPGGGTVDLNTADEAALDALPGVGPSTAKKIVADREQNGPFKSAEDLMRVPGIGPKKFDSLKDLVSAGP